jgi:hypothetical protein
LYTSKDIFSYSYTATTDRKWRKLAAQVRRLEQVYGYAMVYSSSLQWRENQEEDSEEAEGELAMVAAMTSIAEYRAVWAMVEVLYNKCHGYRVNAGRVLRLFLDNRLVRQAMVGNSRVLTSDQLQEYQLMLSLVSRLGAAGQALATQHQHHHQWLAHQVLATLVAPDDLKPYGHEIGWLARTIHLGRDALVKGGGSTCRRTT